MITLVGGKAGEGKSTFSKFCTEYLLEEHKLSSAIVPFARMVKETAFFMGWDGEKDTKGRKLLQEVGNIGRDYDIDLWANHAIDFITGQAVQFDYVFIDDWRFPNEGDVVEEHFLPIFRVRVKRPKEFHTLRGTPLYNDVSEISLPDDDDYYDIIIENNGDMEYLETLAHGFVNTKLLERGK